MAIQHGMDGTLGRNRNPRESTPLNCHKNFGRKLFVPVHCTYYANALGQRTNPPKRTQQPVHLTRDADAHSCANVRSLSNRSPKPRSSPGAWKTTKVETRLPSI